MLRVIFISILVSFAGNAQNFVTINDEHFVEFLRVKFPACMNENQLDISCEAIVNEETLVVSGLHIKDLNGIQYFTHLKSLECVENELLELPVLPSSLIRLDCGMNQLKALPVLPASLEELSCAVNQLMVLPVLPASLKILYCNFNQLEALPVLPSALEYLACGSNKITCLPELPETIFIGDVTLNPLTCVSGHAAWMDAESQKLPVCKAVSAAGSEKCICISTSIVDGEENEIKETEAVQTDIVISPNPTKGNITIKTSKTIDGLCVKDIHGHAVLENQLRTKELKGISSIDINLSELINGIYFVHSTIGNEITIHKVVKTN